MLVRTLLALALLAGPAIAAEPPEPVSPNAVWFRVKVDIEPPRIIEACVDESKGEGTGFDRFVVGDQEHRHAVIVSQRCEKCGDGCARFG